MYMLMYVHVHIYTLDLKSFLFQESHSVGHTHANQ